jgi:hypothetical protein
MSSRTPKGGIVSFAAVLFTLVGFPERHPRARGDLQKEGYSEITSATVATASTAR